METQVVTADTDLMWRLANRHKHIVVLVSNWYLKAVLCRTFFDSIETFNLRKGLLKCRHAWAKFYVDDKFDDFLFYPERDDELPVTKRSIYPIIVIPNLYMIDMLTITEEEINNILNELDGNTTS